MSVKKQIDARIYIFMFQESYISIKAETREQESICWAHAPGSSEEQAGEPVNQQLGEEEGWAGASATGDICRGQTSTAW